MHGTARAEEASDHEGKSGAQDGSVSEMMAPPCWRSRLMMVESDRRPQGCIDRRRAAAASGRSKAQRSSRMSLWQASDWSQAVREEDELRSDGRSST